MKNVKKYVICALIVMMSFWFSACNPDKEIDHFLASIEHPGRLIKDVDTDQSSYDPGAYAQITVLFNEDLLEEDLNYTIDVSLTHLNRIIINNRTDQTKSELFSSFVKVIELPSLDFMGYLLEIYVYIDDQLVDFQTSAIDVSSTWQVFPRYAAISHYDLASLDQIDDALRNLNAYHVNALMFYDVIDRHDKPLAGDLNAPLTSWNTINQSIASKEVLDAYLSRAKGYQMNTYVYNLLFGAYEDYASLGIDSEWGIYKDHMHQDQDFHPLPSAWETSKLYLFDPENQYWQDYYIHAMSDFLAIYDFDGIQVDSLGNRGKLYDYEGNLIYLNQRYNALLTRLEDELNTSVIFNPVDGYGLDETLLGVYNDIIYMEVWGGTYYQLHKTLRDIYHQTNGNIGTVLAAYMNYGNETGYFNEASVHYTNATIMASGGSHMELSDSGMLSKEYYPGQMLSMSDQLSKDLKNYYNFQVAYENYLRGPGLVSIETETVIKNHQTSSYGESGKIWTFSNMKDDSTEILHLINFETVNDNDWVDSNRLKKAPEILQNIQVKHYYTHLPSEIIVASPDIYQGISWSIPFQIGSDRDGDYVIFNVPYLEYYTMIVMV
jgi:dextranase